MFNRTLYAELIKWKTKTQRLPLILRGARQTGKTTLIKAFGQEFKHFIYLNLEDFDTRKLFSPSFSETLRLIELKSSRKIIPHETLLFLDEIQACPQAISHLRFFYETLPNLFLICAGSLLEIRLSQKQFSFPTGRVEYLFLTPLTFFEFLEATDKHLLLELLQGDPGSITPEIHQMIMKELYVYFQVGGMPAAIQNYIRVQSFAEVKHFHTNLYQSILDDIAKYLSKSETKYIELVFESAPFKTGERIIYGNFNNSGYGSREIKHAFEILQKALLVYRVFPTSAVNPPMFCNLGRAPKLFFFDIGLTNSRLASPFSGEQITAHSGIRGHFAEQFVFQELMAQNRQIPEPLFFWAREKSTSHAEIDFCGIWNNQLMPLEVKSGATGRLKSLGVFMEQSSRNLAVRFCNSQPGVNRDVHTGKGLPFTLIDIPLYLAGRWQDIVGTFI